MKVARFNDTTVASTASWTSDGTCDAADSAEWRAVPTTFSTAAMTTVATTQNSEARFRFGLRTAAAQPPGRYLAPITFEVIAPGS